MLAQSTRSNKIFHPSALYMLYAFYESKWIAILILAIHLLETINYVSGTTRKCK